MNRVNYNFYLLYVVELHNLKLCGKLDVVEPQGGQARDAFIAHVEEMTSNHHSLLVPEPEIFVCKTCNTNFWDEDKFAAHTEDGSSVCYKLSKLPSKKKR